MRIIHASSGTPISSQGDAPKLSEVQAVDCPHSSEVTKLQAHLHSIQDGLNAWREQSQADYLQKLDETKKQWSKQTDEAMALFNQSLKNLEERMTSLEGTPRYSEERLQQQIASGLRLSAAQNPHLPSLEPIRISLKTIEERLLRMEQSRETLVKPAESAQVLTSWEQQWNQKDSKLKDLRRQLSQLTSFPPQASSVRGVPEIPLSVVTKPIDSEPAERPVGASEIKKQIVDPGTYSSSTKDSSFFAKLWLYLNESAIEIPSSSLRSDAPTPAAEAKEGNKLHAS